MLQDGRHSLLLDDYVSIKDVAVVPTSLAARIAPSYVLFLYIYLAALQSLLWMTYSSVPDDSRSYLGVDDSTLNLWLNYGPIAFCFSVFPALWLLAARRSGLAISIRLGFAACTFSAALRCLPLCFSDAARAVPSTHAAIVAATHVAQFINGAVAPLAVMSPSYLSLVWFSEGARNTVTAAANVASAAGRGVGFFLGPAIVTAPSSLPSLLLLELALSALPCLASFLWCPTIPESPPSRAAAAEATRWTPEGTATVTAAEGGGLRVMLHDALAAVRHLPVLLCAVSGGLVMALYGAWSGTLTSVLSSSAGFTDAQAGNLGCVNTFAGIVGGLFAGVVTDLPSLRRSLKGVIGILAVSSGALFAGLAAALPPLSGGSATLPYGALMSIAAFAGLLKGGTDPLYFELCAELAHDVGASAGAAGALLTLAFHLALVAVLSVPAAPLTHFILVGMPVALVVAAALLIPIAVRYSRRA